MRRVLGGLAVLVALGAGLLLLGDGGSEDPTSPEAVEHALDDDESLAGPLPAYVPPPPPPEHAVPEPETRVTEEAPLPTLEGKKESFLFVRVVDPDGAPVPRAWVHVEAGKGEDWREHVEETEDGVAKIPAPGPRERMHVEVTRPRDADGNPLNLLERRLTHVRVDAAELTVVLPRARRLCGRVVDDDGSPVGGVRVRVGPPDAVSAARRDVSAPDGSFRVEGLPAGTLEVRSEAPPDFLRPETVTVEASLDHVEVVLERKRPLTILVLDERDRPLVGARVGVSWRRGRSLERAMGRTDDEGIVRVDHATRKARFTIQVMGEDGDPLRPNVLRGGVPYQRAPIVVRVPLPVALSGRLVDEGGRAVPVGQVLIRGADATTEHVHGYVNTEDGRFSFPGLLRGPYEIRVTLSPEHVQDAPLQVVAPRTGVRVVLRRAFSVTGTVHADDAAPIHVAWFTADFGDRTAGVEPSGAFDIHHVRDGPGTLLAWQKGTGACRILENVRPRDGPFDLRLEPGAPICGRVEGVPPGRSPGTVYFARGPVRLMTYAQPDGTFASRALPAGSWRVELEGPDGSPLVRVDEVEAGTTDLVLGVP